METLVVTRSQEGSVLADIEGYPLVTLTYRSDWSPEQRHREAAQAALVAAGLDTDIELASAWAAPYRRAYHISTDRDEQTGRHDPPPSSEVMKHSHLIVSVQVDGHLLTRGLGTHRLHYPQGSPTWDDYHEAAYDVAMASGFPIVDVRTATPGTHAVSIMTTTPSLSGPRQIVSLDRRLRDTHRRIDIAIGPDRDRLLDIARALEEYQALEQEALEQEALDFRRTCPSPKTRARTRASVPTAATA